MSYRGSNPPYYISAYGLARKMGFEGTEEEWLNSLTAFYMAQKSGYTGTSEEWVKKLVDPLPEFAIGQVVTLEGGSMATVQITGTKEKPVLNFGIPRGVGMVDAMPLVGGTMNGSINMQNFNINNLPEPVDDGDAVPKNYVHKIREEMTQEAKKKFLEMLSLTGGTMTGAINMNGRRLYNLKIPTEDADAATKKYVDDAKASTHFIRNGTLLPGSWVGDAAPYTQNVNVEGILSGDCPHVTPSYSDNSETALEQEEAWSTVSRAKASDGYITFICSEYTPELEIPIQIEVNR